MPILARLREFLESHDVEYEVQDHPEGYTAQQVAQAVHVKGRDVAKVVIIRSGDQFHMLVLPAVCNVNLERLGPELGVQGARLATEEEFKSLFPGCETGAMPPFGNLFNVPVAVDQSLTAEKKIVCQAGNHRQTVSLNFTDFERLVRPKIVSIGVHV
jgi:Ala-tRNA(Pro) deacylase